MPIKKLFSLLFILISHPSLAIDVLRIATTTSTENSGLLAVLHPTFETENNIRIDVIAVGTGKALKIGGNGDVDVVLVHAPEAELEYITQGLFIDRVAVMYNDFVIVGAKNDPANLQATITTTEALQKIAEIQSSFISRGDDSGTHKKEKKLWKQAGINPKGAWYIVAGQGMGAVLRMADDKQAYTLTDRGTHIAYANNISLKIHFEGDPPLFNPYHVMAVNPKIHPHVHYNLAKKYINFITGEQGQKMIGAYKKSGQQLFYPNANSH